MTARERILATLTFGNPDKVPLRPGSGRKSTLARWRSEGLPEGVGPVEFVFGELGIPMEPSEKHGFYANFRMVPTFEEKVLSHENGHYIVQDWMGAVTEISDEYDYTYIRNAIDFVTRKWHRFPVQTTAEWEDMKKRFNPMEPARLPGDLSQIAAKVKNRPYAIEVSMNGPFWQLREWLGMEELCIAFLDRPELVADMIDFWKDFTYKLLERFLPYGVVDILHINEDMAYKAHSMISPAMTRRYIQPVYEAWAALCKKHGSAILDIDSDGYVEELIPIWIDSGIHVCDPIEVAAHNDIVKYRAMFGRRMAYQGGVDKRAMAKGGQALVEEINRVLPPLLKTGGFVPGCDHGIPHDVSLDNYRAYVKLMAQHTGWL